MALSSLSRLREIARGSRPSGQAPSPGHGDHPAGSREGGRELTYEPVDADGLPIDTRVSAVDAPAITLQGARLHETAHGPCLVIEHLFEADRSHGRVRVQECGAVCVDET